MFHYIVWKEKSKMKRIIVAIQNNLVSEVITEVLKSKGMYVLKSISSDIQTITTLCDTFFADILVMDVTRFNEGTIENRTKIIDMVKKFNSEIKVCLICDNISDNELSYRVTNAKALGFIDAFFYQSVPSDYIADVISTM